MIASSIKAEVVKANARAANDTGSPEVQVALLTARSNVAVSVFGPQIVQQFTTTTHHAQQTAATVMVFGVCFEMGCQLVDASCEQSHLDFGATRVIGGASIGLDDLSLDRGCNHFSSFFSPLNQSSNAAITREAMFYNLRKRFGINCCVRSCAAVSRLAKRETAAQDRTQQLIPNRLRKL